MEYTVWVHVKQELILAGDLSGLRKVMGQLGFLKIGEKLGANLNVLCKENKVSGRISDGFLDEEASRGTGLTILEDEKETSCHCTEKKISCERVKYDLEVKFIIFGTKFCSAQHEEF